jgi:hypothetical protein
VAGLAPVPRRWPPPAAAAAAAASYSSGAARLRAMMKMKNAKARR